MATVQLCARHLVKFQQRPCMTRLIVNQVRNSMFSLNDPKAGLERNPLTDIEESKEEFKYVEKILPQLTVPDPPKHDQYPTPSGWIPPAVSGSHLEYYVERTRFHNMPVYTEQTDGGTRKLTKINRVKGDIWKFDMALREFLLTRIPKDDLYTQVDEVREIVRVRGFVVEHVVDFLLEKGF